MIKQAAYGTEPWRLVEKELDLDLLAQSESIFALSNGHIGLRGNLDEGDPHGLPGTYLNSMYEVRPLPYAEAGYGYPDDGQTVINVTNGKIIRLLVDDEPFDIRYGTLNSHERVLDLRAGTLTRTVDWTSPAGARIKVTSVRVVSLTQRAIAAINYTVEPVDQKLRIVLQSELVTNEEMPKRGNDPRLAAILEAPLVSEEHQTDDGTPPRVVLVHRTRVSGLRMAAGMSHVITGPAKMASRVESHPDLGRCTVATEVAPGEQLNIVKFIGYGWSSQRSRPALIDQIIGALSGAQLTGWDGLLAEQRAYLDEFWDGADVEVDGDAEVHRRRQRQRLPVETRIDLRKGLNGEACRASDEGQIRQREAVRLLKRPLAFAADTVDCSEVDLDRLEDMRNRPPTFRQPVRRFQPHGVQGDRLAAQGRRRRGVSRGVRGGGVRRSWRRGGHG